MSLGSNCSSLTCEQLCQYHLRTIVPTSLGNNVPASLLINCTSVAWEQSLQYHLGTIVLFSLENNHASFTWEQSWQSHLGIIVILPQGYNRASVTWEQLWQRHLITLACVSKLFYKGQGFSNWFRTILHAEFKNTVHFPGLGLVSEI